jgi:hypothetical protein
LLVALDTVCGRVHASDILPQATLAYNSFVKAFTMSAIVHVR